MRGQNVVDVHAHIVPPSLISRLSRGPVAGVSLRDGYLIAGDRHLGPIPADMTEVGQRIAWMDGEGISVQWVSPWLDLFTWHNLPSASAEAWTAAVNESLLESTAASWGRLRPVPFVDLAMGSGPSRSSLAELLGFEGLAAVIVNAAPGISLSSPSLEDWWTAAAQSRVPILLHPPGNGPSCSFTIPVLQNLTGRIIDTSAAVADLMVSGTFERAEGVEVIIVHGGGFLPYQAFRLKGLSRAGLLSRTAMTRSVSETLRLCWYDTVALDALSLELLVRRVGEDRVLLGSDAPFAIGDPHPLQTVRESGLSDDAKDAISEGNAARLCARGLGGLKVAP